ncbi:aldehyde dehydrogenase family protein [Paenibacillus xerothermodurans]|nr:aldehyde dehydrogenase family protein [Paenibacillus xerothermodurans]
MRIGSLINGVEVLGGGRQAHDIRSPYNGEVVGVVEYGSREDVERAVETAHRVFHETMKTMPAHQRSEILRRSADRLEAQLEDFATVLVGEAGKPIRDAQAEVGRAVQLLRFTSEEAKANNGELIKVDSAAGGENRIGFAKRYPIGVVAAITPFNFPLNLVLHKVATAFAAGCTVVLKPAEKTPLSAMKLAKLLEEAGFPKGALNVVNGTGVDLVEPLVTHPLVKKVTFTGSGPVGWKIKDMAGPRKVTLELGSNSPNIVLNDANLELAVASIVRGGFAFSGQACISVQRVYVQRDVYAQVLELLVPKVAALRAGDPALETTDIGPMISEQAASRAEEWIREAADQGATILTGGERNGNIISPTVLADTKHDMKVVCQEVFAPLITVIPFDSEAEAVAAANDSDYGLQAGLFTTDINRAFRVADMLETGGVWINDVSTFRTDHIPYGGVKMSGVGKEGVKYAIEDMTETKFIGIRLY